MIREVRGRGLMLVAELHPERVSGCYDKAAVLFVPRGALQCRRSGTPRAAGSTALSADRTLLRKEWLSNDRLWRRVQIAASVFASKT
jgi:hypothetical protein